MDLLHSNAETKNRRSGKSCEHRPAKNGIEVSPFASPGLIKHAAQSDNEETESSREPVTVEAKHPFFSDLSGHRPDPSGHTPQGRTDGCPLDPFADFVGPLASVPRSCFRANRQGGGSFRKLLKPGNAAVERKWRGLARLGSLIGINATAVELRLGETLAQMLNERLLEGGIAEIAEAIGSKKAYPFSAN